MRAKDRIEKGQGLVVATAVMLIAAVFVPQAWAGHATPSKASVDLRVTLTDTPDPVRVDEDLTYSAQVANAGKSDAESVLVSTSVPQDEFASARSTVGTCVYESVYVTCSIPKIASGTSVALTIVVRPKSASPRRLTMDAWDASGNDRNPDDNEDTEATHVDPATDGRVASCSEDAPATPAPMCARGFQLDAPSSVRLTLQPSADYTGNLSATVSDTMHYGCAWCEPARWDVSATYVAGRLVSGEGEVVLHRGEGTWILQAQAGSRSSGYLHLERCVANFGCLSVPPREYDVTVPATGEFGAAAFVVP